MRIELTIDSGVDGRRDVAVTAPESALVAHVRPALCATLDAATDEPLWLGDRPLADAERWADCGVHRAAVVGLGTARTASFRAALLSLDVVGGPDAGRSVALERGRIVVGRGADCDLVLVDADTSRRHAAVEVTGTSVVLRDLASTNGTWVDDQRVDESGVELRPGSVIRMGDSLLTVAGPAESPAARQAGPDGTLLVLRPPRRAPAGLDSELTLPTRSATGRPRGVQWVTALLPAIGGAAIAWFAHSPQFLLFALLSPLMMVSSSLGDRLHWRRSRRREAATFRRRRAAADAEIRAALAAEVAARRRDAPDAATLARVAALPSSRVWERQPGDRDFLALRVGTADLPSRLRTREGTATGPAGVVRGVPLAGDLRRGSLGLAGPADVVDGLARWAVGQLAALHSPVDVEIALLASPPAADAWSWLRWLPHVRGRTATDAQQCAALVADVAVVVEQRRKVSRSAPEGWSGPWLVIVVDRAGQLAEVPGLTAVLARGASVGVVAICVDEGLAGLPASCSTVVHVTGETGTRILIHDRREATDTKAVIDRVSPQWADCLARDLAPLVDAGTPGAATIPDHCGLLDALQMHSPDPDELATRWATSAGGARTPLGRSGDGPLLLDLIADGPHALVAGTTGAGKSELLQTMVAGLAANHPPDEVNFLLVDYKGGAAFAECARLPHTAGLVTDLDPYLTERALRSLRSELRRRERLFAGAGVSDLSAYRASEPAHTVPRLIIVVDEFASLVDELPDFVRGLIGVAQRGRSLGVHLVLATQRPGSAVSAEIRANTSLRIALRVTDPSESSDVIDAPDAAGIDRAVPGRAYLRTGTALTCFQTAHAANRAEPDPDQVSAVLVDGWRPAHHQPTDADSPTDLARLVGAVSDTATRTGRRRARSPWLPPLPDALPRSALPTAEAPGEVVIGRVDLPDEQRHTLLSVDVAAGGSLLVAGGARSGRTTALASLTLGAAAQRSPAALTLYVVSADGALARIAGALPHAATVLGPTELALVPRLLARLMAHRTHRADGSTALLVVDGWDRLVSALPDLDAAGCSDALAGLLRVGPSTDLALAVSGDRVTLAPRFSAGFGARLLLRLPDRSDYGMAGIASRDVPGVMPPGRGLRAADGAAVQIAHPGDRPDEPSALACAERIAADWAGERLSDDAIRIRALPQRVTLAELPGRPAPLAIGLAGDQLDCMAIDPFTGAARMLVAGPPRSGRTTLLRLLAQQAAAAAIRTFVAAPARSTLADMARGLAVPVIEPAADVGAPPREPTLLLVDDSEAFVDSPAGERLTGWLRSDRAPLAAVVAGRSDDLATAYRGVGAEVRRSQCGILLRPGPVDGELLGVRLSRRPSSGPPGRGVVIGDPAWGALFHAGEPVPIQVATP